MSSASSPPPPSLTTIDALLGLVDFLASPQNVARVKELQSAEVAAKAAEDAAKKQSDRTIELMKDHRENVAAHEKAVAQLQADQVALKKQQDQLARKLAKMKEAEAL